MRQIINLGALASLIVVVAIALTTLIVDQSPTQIQGEGDLPTVSVDTWPLEVALLQDDEGEDSDDDEENGCLGEGEICTLMTLNGECCNGLTCTPSPGEQTTNLSQIILTGICTDVTQIPPAPCEGCRE